MADNSIMYDVIIVGAGPAGMTAAIYGMRAELKTLLIERNYMGGGQIINTYEVDNYPGLPGINGFELGEKMSEHVDRLKADRLEAQVLSLKVDGIVKKVETDQGGFFARTVIIATGNSPSMLNVKGESDLTGMGVSYCATCDGAFFKNKVVCVVGGGDVAVEDAIFLARGCSKVYLIHRRNELRAVKSLQSALLMCSNVEIIWNSVVTSIEGKTMVDAVNIKNVKDSSERRIELSGVFVAVGNEPNGKFSDILECNEKGYIVAGESCETSVKGVFAAGDIRAKRLRQVSTAVGDGANAITSVQDYLTTCPN